MLKFNAIGAIAVGVLFSAAVVVSFSTACASPSPLESEIATAAKAKGLEVPSPSSTVIDAAGISAVVYVSHGTGAARVEARKSNNGWDFGCMAKGDVFVSFDNPNYGEDLRGYFRGSPGGCPAFYIPGTLGNDSKSAVTPTPTAVG